MIHEQRETLSQRICNCYCRAAKKSVKAIGNYLEIQTFPQSIVYYLLKKI